ncbi:MAG TPA: hypothetical protein VMT05_05385, partial [Terriglobales bacterium]|nr:hypothetical protein [Terriglobales bacterium]
VMISKCANPACSVPFLYMRDGKLFRMEYDAEAQALGPQFGELPRKTARRVEHFWLCGSCSISMTLIMSGGKVETVTLDTTGLPRAAAS